MEWLGVYPAITTPFRPDLSVNYEFIEKHVDWLIRNGSRGIVALGSLGEGATLTHAEKLEILACCRRAADGRVPVVAGISGLSTADSVELARAAQACECEGLMVLPPYAYHGDARETEGHFGAVIGATPLSCMLYNNPIAYGTDVLPAQVARLAQRHANLHAVKESSADVRRITGIRNAVGDRLSIFVGVDDLVLEGVQAGAVGWIAGLVNALPAESVALFDFARGGRIAEARAVYEWFLPLLRLDTVPKFVQLIKLVQEELGMGSSRVRPPRLELTGAELDSTLALVRERMARRPKL